MENKKITILGREFEVVEFTTFIAYELYDDDLNYLLYLVNYFKNKPNYSHAQLEIDVYSHPKVIVYFDK